MNNEGIFGRGERLKAALALLAALALVAGLATVTAEAGSGGPTASTAKKKCKKAKKASSAKRKKCKKKKKTAPAQTPQVRATLTWTGADANDADLDLFVFAADGKIARPGADAIPLTSISGDATGLSGTETFTDNAPKPARAFSFGVCYQVGGSAHAPFTITYVTADGVSHTETRDPGSSFHYDFPGGAPIPSGYCPN